MFSDIFLRKFVLSPVLDQPKLRRGNAHLPADLFRRLFPTVEPDQDLSIPRRQRAENPVGRSEFLPANRVGLGVVRHTVDCRGYGPLHDRLHKCRQTFRLMYLSILNSINHVRHYDLSQFVRAIRSNLASEEILDASQEVSMELMDSILAPTFNLLYQEREKRSQRFRRYCKGRFQ